MTGNGRTTGQKDKAGWCLKMVMSTRVDESMVENKDGVCTSIYVGACTKGIGRRTKKVAMASVCL